MKSLFIIPICLLTICLAPSVVAEVVTLESKNGKKMMVNLIAKQGDKVIIKRVKDGKKFTISPDTLSKDSKELIESMLNDLETAYPTLDASVTIGKRRQYDRGSSYMKRMAITAKITLLNKDHKMPCPPCTMNIVFIGQDQRDTDRYTVLSNQKFDITPTPKSPPVESTPFITRYDSDNKGDGNIGGYKYFGYLLVVTGKDGKVVYTKTTSPVIKKALELDASAAKSIKSYESEQLLDKSMKPAKWNDF